MKNVFLLMLSIFLVLHRVRAIEDLPAGVPRQVNPDGSIDFIDTMFTTPAFQNEGLRLVIEEANKVANELKLNEKLPITKSNLCRAFIGPFGYTYKNKGVGNVDTTNYSYGVEQSYKFSDLTIANFDARCREYFEKYQWPIERLDTNAAYQLATQWLTAVHMDVKGLNRDFDVHVALDPYWHGVQLGQLPKHKFSPIYYLWWTPKDKESESGGAYVELFLPTKTLLQLSVGDAKYILRPPVVFTNLAALFPGKATITTNWPTKTHEEFLAPP